MKRRVAKPVVFLLLGAIVNIAIAWTCVLNPWHAQQSRIAFDMADQLHWWLLAAAPKDMSTPTHGDHVHIPGADQVILSGEWRLSVNYPPNTETLEQTIRVRAGWPLRSLHGDYFSHIRVASDNMVANRLDWLLRPPRALVSKKVEYQRPFLPLAPLWPRFAINTIFYAAILWALLALPFSLRRRRRIKRGLCPACAYPVGPGNVCSECGRSTPCFRLKERIALTTSELNAPWAR